MKRFAMLVTGLALAACSESSDVAKPIFDIIAPGNENTCPVKFNGSCFPPLDAKLKVLYEGNNGYARAGEAEYAIASGTNNLLVAVFYDPGITPAKALVQVDRFIRDVTAGLADGRYSACAGNNILNYANWIRNKILTNNYNFSDEPALPMCVSPFSNPRATGTFGGGVTFSVSDPYHFAFGPPYVGNVVVTYYVFERQNADGSWTTVSVSTPAVEPVSSTIVTRTWFDPTATGVAGGSVTYTYRALQCRADGDVYPAPNNFCARIGNNPANGYAWVTASVTITDPAIGGGTGGGQCLNHDNSNKDPATNNNSNKDKCDKTPPGQAKKS